MSESKTLEIKFDVDDAIFSFGDSEGDAIARVLEQLAERFRNGGAGKSNRYQNIVGLEPLNSTESAPIIGTFRLR